MLDQRLALASESDAYARLWESWQGKGALIYHIELIADVTVYLMTLAHYLHVWSLHRFTFNMIGPVLFVYIRSVVTAMHKRIRTYRHYRAATYNLNNSFPDVLVVEGLDAECAICREDMTVSRAWRRSVVCVKVISWCAHTRDALHVAKLFAVQRERCREFFSNTSDPDEVDSGRKLGFAGYLATPISC